MNVLYLSYTGLAEPLGQSQVLAYLRGLSGEHSITLVTYEKPADLADAAAMTALRKLCGEHGIRWIPRRYHHRPRIPATAFDLVDLAVTAWGQARKHRIELVHARSSIPAFVALALKRLLHVPFVFDMRAFWREELVTAGRLERNSLTIRLVAWGERLCLRRADALVVLTRAAAEHLKHGSGGDRARVRVIPTCVDLDRFRCRPARETGRPLVIGSIGTVSSGWFRLDWLMAFLRASAGICPDAAFHIVTRDEPASIVAAAQQAGIGRERLKVDRRAPREMAHALAHMDAVAMFFQPAVSELARCPTRMGEALASGLPVVANAGVGDVARIIRRFNVGVVVEDASEPSMRRAAADLARLLEDSELADRCRKAAEDWFSLDAGVAAYHALYREIAAGGIGADPLAQPVQGLD